MLRRKGAAYACFMQSLSEFYAKFEWGLFKAREGVVQGLDGGGARIRWGLFKEKSGAHWVECVPLVR